MLACRTVASSLTTAMLLAALPAAAEPPHPAPTVVVVTPSPTAPLPVAPLSPQTMAAGVPTWGWPQQQPAAPYYYGPQPAYYAAPYLEAERTERRSTVAMALGIVAVAGGGVFLAAGTGVITASCDGGNCGSETALATGLIVTGVVALAVGIPLMVYGNKRVPLGTATSSASPPASLPAWAGAPAGRGWQWRF